MPALLEGHRHDLVRGSFEVARGLSVIVKARS
jgi:hypothetical protein